MLWGQIIKVYTDHKNLTRDALGLTSDRVYHWQLLLEKFAPEIVYIKGSHNSVADAISRLYYNPKVNPTSEFTYSTFGVPAKRKPATKWRPSQSSGVVIMKITRAIHCNNAISMKYLQIVAKKRRYTPSRHLR
jgi:hypothetical protein